MSLESPATCSKNSIDHLTDSTNLQEIVSMNRHWQILALLMLALMVPASACCQVWEGCSTSHECCSCHDDEPEAPAQQGTCPSVTIAHSQVPAQVVLPAMQMIELSEIIQDIMRLNELAAAKAPPVPLRTTAPLELRTTWVFVSRAALPARAPSAQA